MLYREGEVSDRVYIVLKGEFEQERKLAKEPREGVSMVMELLGGRSSNSKQVERNVLSAKMPQMRDVPTQMKLSIFGRGTFVGEDDVLYR